MKKSFTLLIAIILITLFSYLSISILQTKALRTKNLQNQYLYLQAKNHQKFLKTYLKTLDLTDISYIEIEDEVFDIYAKIKKENTKFDINIFVKAKNYDVSLWNNFTK